MQSVYYKIIEMKCILLILSITLFSGYVSPLFDNEINLKCSGKKFDNVSLTAYYPDYNDEDHEKGYQDMKGRKLRTLQDYIDDRTNYVTLAMDKNLNIPYGTKACIPELNQHFGHRVIFQVRDSSSDLIGRGYTRADICVRTEIDSYDITVNRMVTLYLEIGKK